MIGRSSRTRRYPRRDEAIARQFGNGSGDSGGLCRPFRGGFVVSIRESLYMDDDATISELLRGQTAIVTGGGSIGAYLSVRVVLEGANAVVAQRSSGSAEAVVERIQELGGEATFIQTDVSCRFSRHLRVDSLPGRPSRVTVAASSAAPPNRSTSNREGTLGVLCGGLPAFPMDSARGPPRHRLA